MSSVSSTIVKRCASSAAHAKAAAPRVVRAPEAVRVSTSSSGLKVATLENHSPVSRVAAVVKTGARDEAQNQLGASHALRVFSSLATRNYSLFGLSRNLNQVGGELTVTSNREETVYLLETTRNNLSRGVDILAEIISRPELRHWEISDAKGRLKFDLDVLDHKPELRVMELLHQAAFRNGLSRSLYAPRYNLGNLGSELLTEFRAQNFTASNLLLVGTGVSHDGLLKFSDLFRLPEGSAKVAREHSRYLGTEVRENNTSEVVHAALAVEGASAASSDALLSSLAAHAFGVGGPRVPYSAGGSRLEKTASALAQSPIAASAFSVSYSDAGLLGFHFAAGRADVGKVARGVYRELQAAGKGGFSEQDVARAKNSYKLALALSLDSSSGVLEALYRNPDNANNSLNASAAFAAVDAVTAADLSAFVKRVAAGRPSLAAVGNLSELPHVDELAL